MEKKLIPNEIMLSEVSTMLSEGHSVIILTKGSSMLPFIVGDRDSVRLRRKESYNVGDIVLARVGKGRWVLHRLISIDGQNAVLKGDGNLDGTEACGVSDIAGYAEAILKPSGREKDCDDARFMRKSAFWRSLPRIVRRFYLAFYRRII